MILYIIFVDICTKITIKYVQKYIVPYGLMIHYFFKIMERNNSTCYFCI